MKQPSGVSTIEQLEPAAVWRLFGGIAAVPRPSKREERIRAHIRSLAENSGWTVRQDAAGNLVIHVPASPGRENAPVIVLQGHLDMVCEKNAGTDHDFDNDPIQTLVEQSDGELLVRADGTTLGADNGMGVALALAAAADPEVVHGPLEILCTIDEEAGMSGAKALEPGFFTGRCLLNLDSEEDDVLYIGCAGGCDVMLTWDLTTGPPPPDAEICRVTVAGLRGGHSGGDIHLNRANAIKLLTQTVTADGVDGLQLADCKGGSLRNAIPREAWAIVAGPTGTIQALTQAAKAVQAEGHRSHGEPNCRVTVEPLSLGDAPALLATADTRALLTALAVLPHGVLAVVPEIPGLVQTSNNVATLVADRGPKGGHLRITVGCLPRSSSADQLHATARQIRAAGQLAGAAVATANDYPGWKPDVDSSVLATCRAVYERLFKEAPNVTAIHAGLECGLIGERVPGMDMVSFGPRIEGAHSPDERVYVASVQKSWKYLKAVLTELAKS